MARDMELEVPRPRRVPKVVALDLDATVWMPELYMMTEYALDSTSLVVVGSLVGWLDRSLAHRLTGHSLTHSPARASHTTLKPLRRKNGECYAVRDGWGQELTFMEDAKRVIQIVSGWEGCQLAYVSRTTEVEAAHLAIEHLHVEFDERVKVGRTMGDVMDHHEIYPGSKVGHFTELKKALGVAFTDMLFLDNESWCVVWLRGERWREGER